MKFAVLACSILLATVVTAADRPSRPAEKLCTWQKVSDPSLGLEAWVQRCNYGGGRKIEFVPQDHALSMRDSDSGEPAKVIRLFDLLPGETPEQGLRRVFDAQTDKKLTKRCVLAPYKPDSKRAGVKRYEFVPDKAYQKELDKVKQDGIPDPPCGDFGMQPDFAQYFEVQPASGARKVMLIDAGQDTPLFDEETLRLLPPKK
jgi:hypothetical protein